MAWFSALYVQDAIGDDQAQSLGLLSALSAVTTRLTQYELLARARVSAVLQHAGYTPPGVTLSETTDAEQVTAAFYRQMAFAIVLRDACANVPGIELPQAAQDSIGVGLSMLDAVYAKKLPVPNVEPDAFDAIDGSQFNVDPSYTPERGAPVFTSLRRSSF